MPLYEESLQLAESRGLAVAKSAAETKAWGLGWCEVRWKHMKTPRFGSNIGGFCMGSRVCSEG